MPWGYTGDPAQIKFAAPSGTKYGQQRYDAFGRVTVSYGLDGAVTLRTRYRGASTDAWDAEDVGPGDHEGTYPTECKDGFGRTRQSIERIRVDGTIERCERIQSSWRPDCHSSQRGASAFLAR
jgi:hypothetical protein